MECKPGYVYRLEKTVSFSVVPSLLSTGESATVCDSSGEKLIEYVYGVESATLTVFSGYAWDGATGVIDDCTIMTAALAHDALYQLTRQGLFADKGAARLAADRTIRKLMIEAVKANYPLTSTKNVIMHALTRFRANYVYLGVRIFAARAARQAEKSIRTYCVLSSEKE